VPYLFIDGTIDASYTYSTWASRISTELNVPCSLSIDINGEYNRTSRTGHVDLQIVATDTILATNLKVRIVLIESNINQTAPNGVTVHNQTFRDLIPNTTGLALSIQRGDTVNLTQAFTCPSPIVYNNSDIVVFVQTNTNHRILQGAKRSLLSMSYNLAPFTLISPENGDTANTCNNHFIWHRSVDSDSGYPISYIVKSAYTPTFDVEILSEPMSETSWVSPICYWNDTTVYWMVTASNGHAPDKECTQVFSFRTHEVGGCQYIIGDANNNGVFNGIDVSYSVGYFKGGPPPPYSCECNASTWYVAGDVNGNCVFNGIDVSYMVSYFKGGAAPAPCPSCPPSRR
jgi:hypothetical protein